MRMAELSRTTGVPVATIKYYVREGLLPRGEVTTSPNQADYGDRHVRRLALVRSLVEVGGLSIAAVRATLAAVDDPAVPLHDTLGMTIEAGDPASTPAPYDEAQRTAEARVDELLVRHGWANRPGAPARQAVIDVVATMSRVTGTRLDSVLEPFAEAVAAIAEADLDTVSALSDVEERVETALVGTVLGDRLIAALRRIAQETVSARRFPPRETP
ncbi:MerR family transcriptional regulator [Pseudonocardia sp. WMMC193]|uniref:MerR family transcriptional regulator n=1 Tax=Pseudonocardia sp. WMMC193 TaxID=2911965 RepID=UPI001EFF6545|nr:MerR family transcriptional regulator [Pseudonocardia sp. WMMC193]MCF7551387.1 MerR family transcriptional regulator [Pseudonocardia sp. WMMC193]